MFAKLVHGNCATRLGLYIVSNRHRDLFASRDPERSKALMGALDAINGRFGRETVRPGGLRKTAGRSMRRANLSPCNTTRIDDILTVRA